MEHKFIKFVFLIGCAYIFIPEISGAAIMVPQASLTIFVNTQVGDSSFNFSLTDCPTLICSNPEQVNLQTHNLRASMSEFINAFPGERYYLHQAGVYGYKIGSIFCTSDNSGDLFWYEPDGVSFTPTEKENIVCTFNSISSNSKTPVLIVPGIAGTELLDGSEKLWPDTIRMMTDFYDDFMDPLQFKNDLMPLISDVTPGKVLKKEITFDYTDGLLNEFIKQWYVEGENLFTFPYDWRYGISGKNGDGKTNPDLLGEKIQEILNKTGSDKVDIIAHSMGGLVVKKYVMDNPASNNVRKAVFVGVPNTGAPSAIKALVQGDNFGIGFGPFGLSGAEMKKLSQNMPGVYDLLPSREYYNTAGSFVSLVNYGASGPTETGLSYQDFGTYLVNDKNLNSQAFTSAEGLHTESFDNYDLRTAGIDLYAVDGCKTATMTNFVEEKYKDIFGISRVDYARVDLKIGDGTVPIQSSTNLPIDQNKKYYVLAGGHSKLLSQDGSRQEIVNLISGSNLSVDPKAVTQDSSQCQLNGKTIMVFSPVDVSVTDQAGNKMGLVNGNIVNGIPNADFEILGEHKFIYLPTDEGQVYDIALQGTDAGTFTIKSQDISNGKINKTEVFSNLPVTPALTGQINLSGETATLLLNNSTTPILPSAVLGDVASEDALPPVSTVTLSGNLTGSGVYNSNVTAKIKAIDSDSGVLSLQYKLDGSGYSRVADDKVNFTVSTEGKHLLTFFATDKMGNDSQEQILSFEIRRLPTSKDQCKKEGWKDFGNKFKNQGDCVSFVENKK